MLRGDTIASVIRSRVHPSSEPVTTIDNPAKVCSTSSPGSSAITHPAACHLRTISVCQSTVNHSVIAAASVGPIPSTAAS